MKYSQQEIATLFSKGKFANIFAYFSDEVVWDIIGEKTFEGRDAVVIHCQEVAKYFQSVQTDFKTHEIIFAENNLIIIGRAKFLQDDKDSNFISACDIYEFNADNKINKISSYCITETGIDEYYIADKT